MFFWVPISKRLGRERTLKLLGYPSMLQIELVRQKMKEKPFDLMVITSCVGNSLYVTDADLTKEVLVTKKDIFQKPKTMYTLLKFWGSNILVSEGDEWRKHRRLADPAFSDANMKLVASSTVSVTNRLVTVWNKLLNDKEETVIGPHVYTKDLAMGVISEAGFGLKIDDLFEPQRQDDNSQMSFKNALMLSISGLAHKAFLSTFIFRTFFKKYAKAYDVLENALNEQIQAAIKRKEQGLQEGNDVLSLLTTSKEDGMVLTPRECLADGFLFYLAGHETTAGVLAFAIRLLAEDPKVQDKVMEELKEIEEFSYATYSKLIYTRCVFKETMRLYPPAAVIPKEALQDTELNGYKVPSGTLVFISSYGLHSNPKLWPNPDQFEPERFDTRVNPQQNTFAYVPFSGGPRSCIGSKFAQVEGTIALAILIKNFIFELEPSDKGGRIPIESMMTIRPVTPLKVVIKKRN